MAFVSRTTMVLFGLAVLCSSGQAREIAYYDANRDWHVIDSSAWAGKGRVASHTYTLETASVTWTVDYLDSGVGFDDPTLGATRRATLDAVLLYLSSVLNENGTCYLQVENSQFDGTGYLATGGSFWFTTPPGFQDCFSQVHITTGVDPCDSVCGLGTDIPDMHMTVDFGHTWNNDMSAPGVSEYDLYSTLLHEFTHGLGFGSTANASGSSTVGTNVFNTYNDLVYTGNGKKLWTGSGFQGISTDLTGMDGGLYFRGANATASYGSYPPLYAPASFSSGSSVSHWDTGTILNNPVMPHATNSGVEKRIYADFEKAALIDLGYANVSVSTPTPSPGYTPASGVGAWTEYR